MENEIIDHPYLIHTYAGKNFSQTFYLDFSKIQQQIRTDGNTAILSHGWVAPLGLIITKEHSLAL